MYDKPHTMASKEADQQNFAVLMARHIAAGGVTTVVGYTPKPLPPRRSTIDPETVLKRKPAPSRRKAKSSSAAKQESDAAMAELAGQLAAKGESLNSAAVLMKCGRMRLSRIAEEHGIEFAGSGSRPGRTETATHQAPRRGTAQARNAAVLREEWP